MTDIQRAARFYCIIKNSFGTDLKSFGVRPRDMQKSIDFLHEVSKRLNRVVIENVDFGQLIKHMIENRHYFIVIRLIMKQKNIILIVFSRRIM